MTSNLSGAHRNSKLTAVPAVTEAAEPQPIPAGTPAFDWGTILEAVQNQGKRWALPVLVVVVVMAGFYGYRGYQEKQIQTAATLLADARDLRPLQEIVTRYAKTPSAPSAMLIIGREMYQSGDYAGAVSLYQRFEKEFPKHPLSAVAAMGQIQCTEAMGQVTEAAEAYTRFAQANAGHYLTPLATLGRARCLASMGRSEDARQVYEEFIAANPKSPWARDAEDAIAEMQRIKRQAPLPTVLPGPVVAAPAAAANVNSVKTPNSGQ
ncbi:MAG: tetratricopeptide repeat protein [bacterium]